MGYSCRTFHKEPARECGVDGVMVSNHGGRQLDHMVSPLRTLPEIAAEAKGMTVILDGSVRRLNPRPRDDGTYVVELSQCRVPTGTRSIRQGICPYKPLYTRTRAFCTGRASWLVQCSAVS